MKNKASPGFAKDTQDAFFQVCHVKSRCSVRFGALVTGTPEVRITGKQYMAALFADEPIGAL